MKITDGNMTAEIIMKVQRFGEWPSGNYAFDFFDCGGLRQDNSGAYIVRDVKYCVEQAHDWVNRVGDFYCDDDNERMVNIISAVVTRRPTDE